MKTASNCDTCIYYIYDEDYDCYCCEVNLDEDEMARFLSGNCYCCPYYRLDDEKAMLKRMLQNVKFCSILFYSDSHAVAYRLIISRSICTARSIPSTVTCS